MTACTVAPVSWACRAAQRRACTDEPDPSTPTTIVSAVLVICASLRLRRLTDAGRPLTASLATVGPERAFPDPEAGRRTHYGYFGASADYL
ncbi:hypothetical protein GCM10009682_28320 [Luedemannella flava]|uniref:Uncharacterized protein n=1 Tax=Luedemannella flava TaxID=349316 RepID=A0ABN2M017_9ACTN